VAQGDTRPMLGNREAMEDLKNILESRAAFYSKADESFDTSDLTQEAAFMGLVDQLRESVQLN
jgi:XRE family aerobic/anaerobic benzoate catabolism transcriptional regulator